MIYDRDYMREPEEPRDARHSRMKEVLWPDAVTLIIIVNVVVFLAQVFLSGDSGLSVWGGLSIHALAEGRVWTVFTHMFVHGGLLHLIGNCLMIFFAGRAVQSLLGARNFLLIYFVSGVIGAALELATSWISGGVPVEIIGASGCGSGVFVALAVMLPQEVITALIYFIIPVRIKLWNLARIMLGISLALGLLRFTPLHSWSGGIAHFAHLGGGLAGWFIVRWLGYGGPALTYDKLWAERQRRAKNPEFAEVKNRRRVADVDEPDSLLITPVTTREFIEREIDPLLDKIAAHGMGSLTEEERKLLELGRIEILNRKK
ncbi:MAG: rhomboid family intramembrane serine protease [Verrucomicrobia bacterium]|nr:rhomboid family intramembrane serine protease [Verrucomicrobiota bacterium]